MFSTNIKMMAFWLFHTHLMANNTSPTLCTNFCLCMYLSTKNCWPYLHTRNGHDNMPIRIDKIPYCLWIRTSWIQFFHKAKSSYKNSTFGKKKIQMYNSSLCKALNSNTQEHTQIPKSHKFFIYTWPIEWCNWHPPYLHRIIPMIALLIKNLEWCHT